MLDLLLQRDGILQQLLAVPERGPRPLHPPHGLQPILRVVVGPGQLRVERAHLAALVDGRREGLAHVLCQPVEGQRRLVGADVQVLGEALARALDLGLEVKVDDGGGVGGGRGGRVGG